MASALQVLRRSPSIIRSSREIISNTVAKNSLTRSPILCSAHRPFPAGFLVQRRNAYESRNVDVTKGRSSFYFDTHLLVKSLESHGFSTDQAEGLAKSFNDILNSSLDAHTKISVTKEQQEIMLQQIMSHIGSVKKDMVILEKSEFSTLRNENEKQKIEITQLKRSNEEAVDKLRSQMKLEINLERARAKEAHADSEKYLSTLDNKIETQVANLRTLFEQYRNEVLKYAAGTVLSSLGICLGFYRIWSS